MAYIKKKSERKFKITVCNGYKVNGQKRMKAQTITVPSSVPKRGIQQYVMAEAERIEKKFKYGVEESDQTHFEQYAENWLKRQEPFFKATTYAGYKRNLDIVYPLIGGIPLAKLLPMTLEEMCEELRKRPGRGGNCIKETTVQKYLETVSSVLEDAKKNDIIPFNPAHRVRKKHIEKEVQHIPQKYEMGKLMRAIQNEPILYRAYYTLAITTGLRRGELCALQWRDITGACEMTVRRSRSCASGQIVESDTKSHRERIVTIPLGLWELLMALRQQQMLHSGVPDREHPFLLTPTVMCHTRTLLPDICASCIKSVGYRKITTCTPCGISTQPICCRKAPANRWRHPYWVMRIRHFWSAPTATHRTWRSVRRQT